MSQFSIKPIRSSGLGDQLGTQFMRLYRLGVACGMEYVYDDLYFPRSVKPNWYDHVQTIHLNIRLALMRMTKGRKCRFASGVNALLMKIEARLDQRLLTRKDDLAQFLNISAIAKGRAEGHFIDVDVEKFISACPDFTIAELKNYVAEVCQEEHPVPRLCWGAGVWAMIPKIDKALEGYDIPSPFAEAFGDRHPLDDVEERVVFHMRCGDSSTVFLPSGKQLIVYDKFLFTSEEQMSEIFAIDNHRRTILPEAFLDVFHKYNAEEVTVISDGFDLTYRNILRNLLKWKCPVALSKEDARSLVSQAKARNEVFKEFAGARLLVGESETLLKESILAISAAQVLVWGVGGFAMNIRELFGGKQCERILNIKELGW